MVVEELMERIVSEGSIGIIIKAIIETGADDSVLCTLATVSENEVLIARGLGVEKTFNAVKNLMIFLK